MSRLRRSSPVASWIGLDQVRVDLQPCCRVVPHLPWFGILVADELLVAQSRVEARRIGERADLLLALGVAVEPDGPVEHLDVCVDTWLPTVEIAGAGPQRECQRDDPRDRPQGIDLSPFTDDDLRNIEFALNNTPRKILGFHTPDEVFSRLKLDHVAGVALQA